MVRASFFVVLLLALPSCKKERAVPVAAECPPPPVCPAQLVTSSDSITLARSRCPFGQCIPYETTLRADGTVTYGQGPSQEKVDPAVVRELLHRASAACFFSMRERYMEAVTDAPGATITVRSGEQSKEVRVYPGYRFPEHPSCEDNPPVLYDLAEGIDRIAPGFPKEG